MKILICSRDGEFASILSRRLKNENNEIYLLDGSDEKNNKSKTKVFQRYDFSYTNENVVKIINNISADLIIIAGYLDYNLQENSNSHKHSVEYITGMTNIILSAKSLNTPRIIYCSSLDVFEENKENEISKDSIPMVSSFEKNALLQVESLIESSRKEGSLNVDIIRFPKVYGNISKEVNGKDFLSNLMYDCISNKALSYHSKKEHNLISVQDIVQVIISIVKKSNSNDLYHIDGEILNEAQIIDIITDADKSTNNLKTDLSLKEDFSYNNFKLIEPDNKNLKFDLRYTAQKELPVVYKALKKDIKDKNKTKRDLPFAKVAREIIETTIFFIIMASLQYYSLNFMENMNVDFYLIFVILVGAVYGLSFSMYATGLTVVSKIISLFGFAGSAASPLSIEFFIEIIQIMLCAIIVGFMRDNYKEKTSAANEENEYNLKQLQDITRINESNVYVKNLYGKRIAAYSNSLARLNHITSQLNHLDARKLIFNTANVVSEIVETEHVAIYVASSNSSFFRLAASTSKKARILGNSIQFNENTYFYNDLLNDEVYMNREFDSNKPTYISAIQNHDGSVGAIVMVWATSLEQVSLYQSSLVSVLNKLIERSMVTALEFEKYQIEGFYIDDSKVMEFDAFKNRLEIFEEGRKMGLTTYTIVRVLNENRDVTVTKNDFAEIQKLVRDTDYIGTDMIDMYILLSNSDDTDAQIVVDRISKIGKFAVALSKDYFFNSGV